jgi:hypothetical protein
MEKIMKISLTPEEKRRRATLVSRIKEWERIQAKCEDEKSLHVCQETLKFLKEMLRKGDEM